MQLVGVILIIIQVVYLKSRVWFSVIYGSEVPEILDTSFMDRLVNAIFSAESKILPNHSIPVAILATTTFYDKNTTVTKDNTALKVS